MYVFHITLRFQILEHELSMVGDFTSVYDTNEKQHQLIIRCAKIHSETLKWALDIFLHNEYQNFPLNQVRSPLFELVLTRVLFRLALGLCRHLHFLLSHTAGNIFFEIRRPPLQNKHFSGCICQLQLHVHRWHNSELYVLKLRTNRLQCFGKLLASNLQHLLECAKSNWSTENCSLHAYSISS